MCFERRLLSRHFGQQFRGDFSQCGGPVLSVPVEDFECDNAKNPRLEVGLGAVTIEMGECPTQSALQHIFHFGTVAEHPPAIGFQGALQRPQKFQEIPRSVLGITQCQQTSGRSSIRASTSW
jgi:hypothetical protein